MVIKQMIYWPKGLWEWYYVML